jgi:hypothetical protein
MHRWTGYSVLLWGLLVRYPSDVCLRAVRGFHLQPVAFVDIFHLPRQVDT